MRSQIRRIQTRIFEIFHLVRICPQDSSSRILWWNWSGTFFTFSAIRFSTGQLFIWVNWQLTCGQIFNSPPLMLDHYLRSKSGYFVPATYRSEKILSWQNTRLKYIMVERCMKRWKGNYFDRECTLRFYYKENFVICRNVWWRKFAWELVLRFCVNLLDLSRNPDWSAPACWCGFPQEWCVDDIRTFGFQEIAKASFRTPKIATGVNFTAA